MNASGAAAGALDVPPFRPWDALEERTEADLRAVLPALGIEHLVHRGAPRDDEAVRAFLREHVPPGELLVHGAGTHSRLVLPTLAERTDVEVAGVIDKRADALATFEGYPVVAPRDVREWLESGRARRVLLSNAVWEMSMRDALLEEGVPTELVLGIYSDPRYVASSLRRAADSLERLPREGCESVLVDFEREGQHVIDDASLAGILPPERTIRLYAGRFARLSGWESVFPSFCFHDSLHLLREMLVRLAPRAVYLRTFIEDNPAFWLVRRLLPEARLVHELYDWGLTIARPFMNEVYGHSDRSIRTVLSNELHSARHADFVVTKRGGPAWRHVTSEFHAPHASYFSQVQARPAAPIERAAGGSLRLVYAGNLPAPHTLHVDMVGGLFPLFERLCATGLVHVTVYNGMHRCASDDATYAHYARAAGDRLDYRPARPYEAILAELPSHDYGWLYFARDAVDFEDERVLISNKFTGYVSAGLPVLVDDGWDYMAALVEEFAAGLVVSMNRPETLSARLEAADRERHRRGVLALREHMLASNRRALGKLKRALVE